MIHESQKQKLKKYRHLISSLISYSIGYFTPLMALRAIEDYKNNQPNFCEWYFDIACKRGVHSDADFIKINRDIIKGAIKYRHSYDFMLALKLLTEILPVKNLSAQVGFEVKL